MITPLAKGSRLSSRPAALSLLIAVLLAVGCQPRNLASYDVIIKGGEIYDGTGAEAIKADIAIKGDQISKVGTLNGAKAERVIDGSGQAVAPGFINMLSWSTDTLIADGNSQSEIRQGVTTQIMGEGSSMGPLSSEMKKRLEAEQGDIKYPIRWTTLAEYLKFLEKKGISQNVASFVGATSSRGYVRRPGGLRPRHNRR